MKIKKKLITFILTFAMALSLIPTLSIQAATTDFKIISDSKVTVKQAKKWAESKGATKTFQDLADLYFKYSSKCGDVNPAIAYVQAAKETGYGKFGGVIDESYKNPCGLKTSSGGDNYDPNAHQKFDSWDEGVQAHMDHLALYAGVKGYPKEDTYDQRQFRTIKGTATTVNALGGANKWAPSLTYGEEISALYKNLMDFAGVEYEKDQDNSKNDDSKNNDKSNESSNAAPNPGTQESKPNAPSVSDVIAGNNTEENKSDITSNIGWKNENGAWYYYKSDNTKAMGWIKENNRWYYLQGDGSMVTGLKKIDNKSYMFNTDGSMTTGWIQLNNYWYYFKTDGSIATGWITDNGTNYYLYDTGAMAKGWININGWHYLKDTGAMATGWVTSNGDSYYLDPSTGRMLTSTTIDGYKIGSDGKKQTSSSKNNSDQDKSRTNESTKNNSSNSKKTIAIDAGHDYGKDYGAENTIDGVKYTETKLNMQVADKLKVELEKRGYNVVMTREENERPASSSLTESLTDKVQVANNANADLFISIHHNSAGATATGVETYYSVQCKDDNFGGGLDSARLEKSKEMAKAINESIANKISAINRGAKSDASSDVGTLFILRNANMPAVLVEAGFITNPEEAKRCANSASQQKVAEAIAEAIEKNI